MADTIVNSPYVLLVEDDPIYIELLEESVENDPHRPVRFSVVNTLKQAKERLDHERFDVVLLDIGLSDSTGEETFETLHDAYPDVPFIVLSTNTDTEFGRRCVELGAQDYLIKGRVEKFISSAIHNTITRVGLQERLAVSTKRINRIDSLLRTGQSVGRLIARETEPRKLIQRACDSIAEFQGYSSCWIAVTLNDAPSAVFVEVGGEPDCGTVAAVFNEGKWPPCREFLNSSKREGSIIPRDAICVDCPFHKKENARTAYAASLKNDRQDYGMLLVTFKGETEIEPEEELLLLDVAGDIALALRNIELLRERRVIAAQFEGVFEGVTDGILLFDVTKKKIVAANSAAHEILRHPPASLAATTLREVYSEASAFFMDTVLPRLLSGEPYISNDVLMRRHDDDTFYADINATSMEIGEKIFLVICIRDVSERHALHANLAQADRFASMGMLAAGVAHEINNPLAYVLYNLEKLSERLPLLKYTISKREGLVPDPLTDTDWAMMPQLEELEPIDVTESMGRNLDDALNGINRIVEIARGLSRFSKVEEDIVGVMSLNDAIEGAVNMALNEIKYRAKLTKSYGDAPLVKGSEGRLSQVFLNLIINAAHAIEGEMNDNEIGIRTWVEGDNVFAEVRDTGVGIPESHLAVMFKPFFSTKSVGVGSGLGLAIAKNIVEGLGGRIDVESSPGKGTRITVGLPAATVDDAEYPEPQVEWRLDRKGRILVIDDEESIRETLEGMLSGQHEVVTVSSGEEGQSLLSVDQRFDLILCDLMMPRVSGVDLHQWLTEYHPELAAQVVFVSGGAFTPQAKAYLGKVSNHQIEKPFRTRELLDFVQSMIR